MIKTYLDAQGLPGISSFHDLILPTLPLPEKIAYIFSSTFDRTARYDQVSATLASSIEKLPSPLKEDADAQTKKIMAQAKKFLNTTSFDDIFDFQTLAQVTLSDYSQEPPSFIERMNDLEGPWRTKPYHWFLLLIKQDRIHCAERVFTLLPPMDADLKSSTNLVLALAYVRHGRIEKALELVKNIPKTFDSNKVYQAIASKYCEEKSYEKVQELLDSGTHDQYLLEDIAILFSKHGQFDRALGIANGLTQYKLQLLESIVLDTIDYSIATDDDLWIDRALSTLSDPSFPNKGQNFLTYKIAEKMIDYGIKANDDRWLPRVLKMSEHPCFDQDMTKKFKRDIAGKMIYHCMKYNKCTDRARALAFSCFPGIFGCLMDSAREKLATDPLALIRNYYQSRNLQEAFKILDSLRDNIRYPLSSEKKEEQNIAVDFLAKKLFKDNLTHEIFDFATRKSINDSRSPILMCCEKLLNLFCNEGRFDDVFRLLGQLREINNRATSGAFIWALYCRYLWNLQHPENPHVFPSLETPPETPPEALIEALATGRYAEVVTLLKESSPQEHARCKFSDIIRFLPALKGAYLADHFPHDWRGTWIEDAVYSNIVSRDDGTRSLYDLLPK